MGSVNTDIYLRFSMTNDYGVMFDGCRSHPAIAWNWQGAPVKVKVFGKWIEGEICEIDPTYDILTMECRDGQKRIMISASRQAFRKVSR